MSSDTGITSKSDILFIDPGGVHTGWCMWEGKRYSIQLWGCLHGLTLPMDTPETLDSIFTLQDLVSGADLVVFENWRLRPDKAGVLTGNTMVPSQVIGMIKYVCAEFGTPWQYQEPTVKERYGDSALKLMNLWNLPKKNAKENNLGSDDYPHIRDAIRHCLYWLEKSGYGQLVDDMLPITLQ